MVISDLMLSPISPNQKNVLFRIVPYYSVLSHVLSRIILYYASKHIFMLGLMGLINYVLNGINDYKWLAISPISGYKWLAVSGISPIST